MSGDRIDLLARIRELEKENNRLINRLDRIKDDVLSIIIGLGGCDATDSWARGYDKAIDSVYAEVSKYFQH